MGRTPTHDGQVVTRLKNQVATLKKENLADFMESAERGKEIEQISDIVRSCADLIEVHVKQKLLLVINHYERRCEQTRRRRDKN